LEIDKVNSARVWVFLIFWTVLFSCKPSEPIRIGFVAGTSGRVADMGISGRDAAQLAIDECNSNGGVSGRQVQLIIKNGFSLALPADSKAGQQYTNNIIRLGCG
jgi:branched-chain amino acid transport system substrate-binding protein